MQYKMKKKATIKDLEAVSGKPDSIRGLNGKNARSDRQIRNLVKEFTQRLPDLTLPAVLPDKIVLHYKDGRTVEVDDVTVSSAVLNFVGQMPRE